MAPILVLEGADGARLLQGLDALLGCYGQLLQLLHAVLALPDRAQVLVGLLLDGVAHFLLLLLPGPVDEHLLLLLAKFLLLSLLHASNEFGFVLLPQLLALQQVAADRGPGQGGPLFPLLGQLPAPFGRLLQLLRLLPALVRVALAVALERAHERLLLVSLRRFLLGLLFGLAHLLEILLVNAILLLDQVLQAGLHALLLGLHQQAPLHGLPERRGVR
mmetsp:Transcript_124747/g.353126  ORF Transcript_124747/g.353126 Transcript_124747/m.353126 type:complete len:218 (-) Transcript_124747:986-1639(-)